MIEAICLTDSPRVVQLKAEFRSLDARTDKIRDELQRLSERSLILQRERAAILDRKAAIGQAIFEEEGR